MPKHENKIIEYKSLSPTDKQNLRNACLTRMRAETKDSLYRTFRELCSLRWCCGRSLDINEMSGSALDVLDYLYSIAPTAKNLFILNTNTELALKYSQLIEMHSSIDFEAANPHAIAWGLKLYIEDLDPIIPRDITGMLIHFYQDQKYQNKKMILQRIPFILTEKERAFFKKFKNLLAVMERHKQDCNMSMNDVADIFSPLRLKKPKDMGAVRLFLLRTILKDILDLDYETFTIDLFEY